MKHKLEIPAGSTCDLNGCLPWGFASLTRNQPSHNQSENGDTDNAKTDKNRLLNRNLG